MKKTLIILTLLAVLALFCFSACDGAAPSGSNEDSGSVSASEDAVKTDGTGDAGSTEELCTKHSFGEWVVLKEANCGDKGEKTRTCTVCGQTETGTVPTKGEHSYGDPGQCLVCGHAMDPNFHFTKNADGVSYSFGYGGTSATVTVPASYNNLPVTALVEAAFADSTTLRTVRLPDSILSFGASAFAHCTGLTSVNTPSGLKTIGTEAFFGCSSLATFKFPGGLERLEYGTFMDSGLTSLSFPKSLTYIGEDAFAGCCSLKTVKIPTTVSVMDKGAFNGCRALTEVTIEKGASLKVIPSKAFSGCAVLKKVTVGEGVERIEKEAFSQNAQLKTLSMPSTLQYLGEKSFFNSSPTLNIDYNGLMYQWGLIEDASPDNWVMEEYTVVNISCKD